jgi:fumarate reductase flavoprotein subunit
MSEIIREADPRFDVSLPVIIVGAGAAGLTAALACKAAGVEPLVLERDALPRGSTALSAGLIPAPGSRWQQAAGIDDSPDRFLDDVRHKTGGAADMELAALVAREAAPTLEWLADAHGLAFSLLGDVSFPGHSRRRLHGLPSRSGAELIDRLRAAAEAADVPLMTGAHVTALIADAAGQPRGLLAARPDGRSERMGFDALVLACNGYG